MLAYLIEMQMKPHTYSLGKNSFKQLFGFAYSFQHELYFY